MRKLIWLSAIRKIRLEDDTTKGKAKESLMPSGISKRSRSSAVILPCMYDGDDPALLLRKIKRVRQSHVAGLRTSTSRRRPKKVNRLLWLGLLNPHAGHLSPRRPSARLVSLAQPSNHQHRKRDRIPNQTEAFGLRIPRLAFSTGEKGSLCMMDAYLSKVSTVR